MRKEPTPAEKRLWQQLRGNRLGVRFRRQHAIDRFIVDFYSRAASLVIEVDGSIHQYSEAEDAVRQEFLQSLGLRVIRFTNDEIEHEIDAVLSQIATGIAEQQRDD